MNKEQNKSYITESGKMDLSQVGRGSRDGRIERDSRGIKRKDAARRGKGHKRIKLCSQVYTKSPQHI